MARNFLWDPIEDNVIAEFDDDGSLLVEYTTEPELRGKVISQRREGETNCIYSDGLGSTTEITNATGNTIGTLAYTAYGEITENTGVVDCAFRFAGEDGYYFDVETNSIYDRRRFYRSVSARWLSREPSNTHLAASSYAYEFDAQRLVIVVAEFASAIVAYDQEVCATELAGKMCQYKIDEVTVDPDFECYFRPRDVGKVVCYKTCITRVTCGPEYNYSRTNLGRVTCKVHGKFQGCGKDCDLSSPKD